MLCKMMPEPIFKHLNVIWEMPENWCEWDHVEGTLTRLEHYLVNLGFADRFVFVVTANADNLAFANEERAVVYQTSDEAHEIPDYINDVFMVFKNYRPFYPAPETLRIVPLGCNKDVPVLPVQAMADRSLDLFFIGRDEYRDDFYAAMAEQYPEAARGPKIEIEKALGFRAGHTPEVYAHKLAQTKIALCPRGVSHETFRIYEALRSGCAVIAARQLPSWFNEGWPVIEVDDWSGLKDLAEGLLGDEKRLTEISVQSRAWWEEKCSEEAVAHYMARELSLRLMKQNL